MFSEEMICSLNDLELEVYKYVVRNADKVCYMRIREFADAAHVSTSTILRFCKKAGCDGYAEFKIRLRQHLEQAKQPPVKDDVSEVIDFLKKTCSAEFEQKLDMLTRVIFQARHIFFVGSGMSGIVAKYGARYFSSMGKFCLYIDEPHYPTESRFVENSLVIVFSVSGESRDTIGHVMRFKEQNCQILSVTNTEKTSGGVDIEGDDSMKERVYIAPSKYSVAGPEGAYKYWVRTYNSSISDVLVKSDDPVEVIIEFHHGKWRAADRRYHPRSANSIWRMSRSDHLLTK